MSKIPKKSLFLTKTEKLKKCENFQKKIQFFFEISILFLFFPFIFAFKGIILTLEQILVSERTNFHNHILIFLALKTENVKNSEKM